MERAAPDLPASSARAHRARAPLRGAGQWRDVACARLRGCLRRSARASECLAGSRRCWRWRSRTRPCSGRELLAAIAIGLRLGLPPRRFACAQPLEDGGWYPPPILGGVWRGGRRRAPAAAFAAAVARCLVAAAAAEQLRRRDQARAPTRYIRAVREAFPAQAAVTARSSRRLECAGFRRAAGRKRGLLPAVRRRVTMTSR